MTTFVPGDILVLKEGFRIQQAHVYDNHGVECGVVHVMRSYDIALVVFVMTTFVGDEVLVMSSQGVVGWMTLGGLKKA